MRLFRLITCLFLVGTTCALAQLHTVPDNLADVAEAVNEVCPPSNGAIIENGTIEAGTVFETYVRPGDVTVVVARTIPAGARWLYQPDGCDGDPNCKSPMPDALKFCVSGNCSEIYNCLPRNVVPVVEGDHAVWLLDDPVHVKAQRIAADAMQSARDAGLDNVTVTVAVD